MDLDDVATELYSRLRTERDGRVLAVWLDGTITVEPFSFRDGRRHPGGEWEPVLLSLPAKAPLSFREIMDRLQLALARWREQQSEQR
ncbi:MAG: hypothetical protein M0R74_16795 [Dehalococcoidia bacterium]|nr:hypothetical protein [Dehalococcoidia bacterium]